VSNTGIKLIMHAAGSIGPRSSATFVFISSNTPLRIDGFISSAKCELELVSLKTGNVEHMIRDKNFEAFTCSLTEYPEHVKYTLSGQLPILKRIGEHLTITLRNPSDVRALENITISVVTTKL
jgi:hypothetical protein